MLLSRSIQRGEIKIGTRTQKEFYEIERKSRILQLETVKIKEVIIYLRRKEISEYSECFGAKMEGWKKDGKFWGWGR